jgi:hypothetical protein
MNLLDAVRHFKIKINHQIILLIKTNESILQNIDLF